LPKTCGQCHPNARENILKGAVHVEATPSVSPGVYAVRVFYTVFIGALLGFFLLHISLDVIRWLRRRYGQGTDQRTE
jgi:NhaP-type Na+/H+ or K+/H+ antiporter